MTSTARTAILAVVGLCLAVAVGLAANAISRDSIGLAPTPVGSGVRLAPGRTTSTAAKPATTAKRKPAAKPTRSTSTSTTVPAPATQAPTTTSGGDDNGGDRGRGGGSGSTPGGSGSNSGSGGSGGGGSGGGSGGHGSDD
jgi:hypothetical protein